MTRVESITLVQLRDWVIVSLSFLAFIVLLGNVIKTIHEWRKPGMSNTQWKQETERKLDNDNRRIQSLEDGNKALCRGVLALLSHEINGNSIDKLQQAYDELSDYLIER